VVDSSGSPTWANVTVTNADGTKTEAKVDGSWTTTRKPGVTEIKAVREGYTADIKFLNESEAKVVLTPIEKPKPTLLTLRVIDKATGKKLDAEVTFDPGAAKQKKMNVAGEFTQEWAVGTHMLAVRSKGYETQCNVPIQIKEHHNNIVTIEMSNKIEYRGTIEFAVASAVLKPESYKVLDDVVAKIKSLCEWDKITVAGHTSSEGTDAYNMKLSKDRAESVRKYLVSKGIDAARLDVAGFGESKPIADNATEAGRAKNRRVEFVMQ
jgi:outer membrane protein OmpA-like peptidoglycan-associated protein